MINLKKYSITAIGVGIGMAGGFLYWKYVGCLSGSCPITSSPINSSLYGAMIGGLFLNLFKKENK